MLSKLGLCSRGEAARWVAVGRVAVGDAVVTDPEHPVREGVDVVRVDGVVAQGLTRRVVMVNKPRGLVTSASDERGRETVYRCLPEMGAEWLAPVGRLDKASEGLLLFTNDPAFAARLTDPRAGVPKTYHVQIDRVPDAALCRRMEAGVDSVAGSLRADRVHVLRAGSRHGWLEVTLTEGRNRHIRRLCEALDVGVLRLVRVAYGPLALGDLPKGAWRELSAGECEALQGAAAPRTGG